MTVKTMTVKEAWAKSRHQKGSQTYGHDGNHFALVGWKSPSTEQISGPYLVTISGDQCIEIEWDGVFQRAYPANAEQYFPWHNCPNNSYRKENATRMAKHVLEKYK